jgi:imidazolonepropionase-like amidohydrolase
MKTCAALLSLLLVACPATPNGGTSPTAAPGPAAGPVTAFVGVNVIPMDGERVLADQTVLVSGDRVLALGPSAKTELPAGAAAIDGRGKYLLPGLAEMHGHIPPPQAPPELTEAVLFL